MIWSETTVDVERGNIQYCKCVLCDSFPAFEVDDEYYGAVTGPFCREHWHDFIDNLFSLLDKTLQNEDWGSSPETRGKSA